MTVHKSQGMTLERAVIDLGEKDFALGLSFVAISRVKTLAGIAFRSPFSVSRLRHNPGSKDTTRDALHKDNQRRSMLPYIHETYNVDLSMYNFLD
jgi:ATP-dependent exoDNAse (exonuclease V) alpha subunit